MFRCIWDFVVNLEQGPMCSLKQSLFSVHNNI